MPAFNMGDNGVISISMSPSVENPPLMFNSVENPHKILWRTHPFTPQEFLLLLSSHRGWVLHSFLFTPILKI